MRGWRNSREVWTHYKGSAIRHAGSLFILFRLYARVAKLVDALPWGGSARKGLEVQIFSRAQATKNIGSPSVFFVACKLGSKQTAHLAKWPTGLRLREDLKDFSVRAERGGKVPGLLIAKSSTFKKSRVRVGKFCECRRTKYSWPQEKPFLSQKRDWER